MQEAGVVKWEGILTVSVGGCPWGGWGSCEGRPTYCVNGMMSMQEAGVVVREGLLTVSVGGCPCRRLG